MRSLFLYAMTVAFAGCLMMASAQAADSKSEKQSYRGGTTIKAGTLKVGKPNLGMLRHVVLFKFKDGATPEQIKAIEDAFRALPKKIPQILDFEWGTNNSPEGKAQGFTHCFFLTFRNDADRAVYLPHPEHKAFGKLVRPHLEKVLVFDYVVKQ